jgi:hypothetical protein
MGSKIYLIQEDDSLREMEERPYATEDMLQSLLAKYPGLLAGDQFNELNPRRWLLVAREIGIPDQQDGSGRWSLDHLFLDQDGIPTLVEVKRASDTRIRREVVGQMLDYAANAVVYWPLEAIRSRFEAACDARGQDPAMLLAGLLEEEPDEGRVEAFWQQVKTNLKAGKIRMIFVADEIPAELRRIVEFLNEQTDPAEVLAVELRQYVGEGISTIVPQVVGQTAGVQQRKGGGRETRQWDEPTFLADLAARKGPAQAEVAHRILAWARQKGLRVWWGKGAKDGSFSPMVNVADGERWTISVWTYGRAEILFEYLKRTSPFSDPDKRLQLAERLNEIPGIRIETDKIDLRPSIPIATFLESGTLERFLAVLDWFVDMQQQAENRGRAGGVGA